VRRALVNVIGAYVGHVTLLGSFKKRLPFILRSLFLFGGSDLDRTFSHVTSGIESPRFVLRGCLLILESILVDTYLLILLPHGSLNQKMH